MPERAQRDATRTLGRRWRQWAHVVAACAKRSAPGGVTRESYARLHRAVLKDCRAAASVATGTEQEFYQGLEGLVLPWMNLEVLARTDREILADLLLHCREAERRLGGRRVSARLRPPLSAGATAAIVVLCAAATLTFALHWWPPWLAGRLENQYHAAQAAWRHLGATNQLLALAVVVLLFVLALARRHGRR